MVLISNLLPRYKDMYAGAPAGVKSKVKRCLGAVTCLSSVDEDYDCFPLEQECLDGEVEEESREGAMSRIARLECQIELILCRNERLGKNRLSLVKKRWMGNGRLFTNSIRLESPQGDTCGRIVRLS